MFFLELLLISGDLHVMQHFVLYVIYCQLPAQGPCLLTNARIFHTEIHFYNISLLCRVVVVVY